MSTDIAVKRDRTGWVKWVGVGLIVASLLLGGLFFVVPFLPLSLPIKVASEAIIFSASHGTFAGGSAILGGAAVVRYHRLLNPVNWFRRDKSKVES